MMAAVVRKVTLNGQWTVYALTQRAPALGRLLKKYSSSNTSCEHPMILRVNISKQGFFNSLLW
jgi:hypothetical protein